MTILSKIKHWCQQPSTLHGLSLLIGGGIGLWLGSISPNLCYTMFCAAGPLLLPDNTTAQRIWHASALPIITALSRHGMPSLPVQEMSDNQQKAVTISPTEQGADASRVEALSTHE